MDRVVKASISAKAAPMLHLGNFAQRRNSPRRVVNPKNCSDLRIMLPFRRSYATVETDDYRGSNSVPQQGLLMIRGVSSASYCFATWLMAPLMAMLMGPWRLAERQTHVKGKSLRPYPHTAETVELAK